MPLTKEQMMKAIKEKGPQGPELPDGHFALLPEDKPLIRKFGKELSAFIYGYAQKEGGLDVKILVGGLDYLMTIVNERKKLLANHFGDELLRAIKAVDEADLSTKIEEPFQDTPGAPEPAASTDALPDMSTRSGDPVPSPAEFDPTKNPGEATA